MNNKQLNKIRQINYMLLQISKITQEEKIINKVIKILTLLNDMINIERGLK